MTKFTEIIALRGANEISQKEIEKLGFLSHPENLQSERYKNWTAKNCGKQADVLIKEMKMFLESKDVITQYEQIPTDFRSIITFAEERKYQDFTIKDFIKKVDIRKLQNEFGKDFKKTGCHSSESTFGKLITNFADQLIARTKVQVHTQPEFDILEVMKTLHLVKVIFQNGKEKVQTNTKKHFEKPIILNSCIQDIDFCSEAKATKVNPSIIGHEKVISQDGTLPNKEKKCKCQEEKDDCSCKCNEECVDPNARCVSLKPYIAELFVLKDKVCKYEPGELAYIKNVQAGETQERIVRDLNKETRYAEVVDETEAFEEKFQQVKDNSKIHSEMEEIVKSENKFHAGTTYGTKKGPGLFVEGSYDHKNNRSRTNKLVQDKTKDILEKLTTRLKRNTKNTTRTTVQKELEVTNTSRFEGGKSDRASLYYSVDEIRKTQVYSHGMRSFYDFRISEPSALYRRLLEKQFSLKEPKKPCINIKDLNPANYLEYVEEYGFTDLERIPDLVKYVDFKVTGRHEQDRKHNNAGLHTGKVGYTIPEGYEAVEMTSTASIEWDGNGGVSILIKSGTGEIVYPYQGTNRTNVALANLTGSQTANYTAWDAVFYMINVNVKCVLDSSIVEKWQVDLYGRIQKKYQDDLEKYKKGLKNFEEKMINQLNNKTAFEQLLIIKEQIKLAAIEYISCHSFIKNDAMLNKVKPCGFPQMNLPETKKQGELTRFLDLALDWNFMNFTLDPFYTSRQCTWVDKFKDGVDNVLFNSFLNSGSARVVIPVNLGYESSINYYISTGQIWNGGQPPVFVQDAQIINELKESQGNFNTDRDGYVTWKSSMDKNEVLLHDNLDYYEEDLDSIGNPTGTYSFSPELTKVDIHREITINCVTYKILSITEKKKWYFKNRVG